MSRIGSVTDPFSTPRIESSTTATARPWGRRVGDLTQEPIDAEFRIIDETPRRTATRRSTTGGSRTSLQSIHQRLHLPSAANLSSMQRLVLRAYMPYQDERGAVVDTWV